MRAKVHEKGLCETNSIGNGTTVWAFSHILPGAVIGEDCNICDHVFVENDVVLGDRVTVKSGVQIWDGTRIGNDVFIGPNASLTNDPFPRSKHYRGKYPILAVDEGASLGANCTLLPGLRIGRNAMVGAGSVVTKDVPPYAIVRGNPARITGYVDGSASLPLRAYSTGSSPPLDVPGVKLQSLSNAVDLRGALSAVEFANLPFIPRRVFLVYDVPTTEVRGEHAHRSCEQFLICAQGQVSCVVDDGHSRQELLLDDPGVGLYVPAMIWGTQYRYSADASLLVLASLEYDPDDYIRDYSDFLQSVAAG
jgi:UDP-2-acetamido-3-amino-2,3-dideoxy-glucuronate N-acetyltransferase